MSAPWLVDLREQGLILDDWDAPDGTCQLSPGGLTLNVFGNTGVANSNAGASPWLSRPYYLAAIAYLGQAWDNNGNGNMTWSALINGQPFYPFGNKNTQFAPPFGDTNYLPQPIWLPQLATVQFSATLAGAAGGNSFFTARMILYYFRQNKNLQKVPSLPGYSHLPGGIHGMVAESFKPRG